MKNLITNTILVLILIFIISCRKDDTKPKGGGHDGHNHVHSNMTFKVSHAFGTKDFYIDSIYEINSNMKLKVSRVEFYISNPQVLTSDNKRIDNYDRTYLLIQPNIKTYELGKADFSVDHLHKIKLNIGVDSIANHSDPTTYENNHALSLKSPSMHWSWNTGYRFLVLAGKVDINNDGEFDNEFNYHIGTDKFLVEDTLHLHKNITTAGLLIPLKVDYKVLFNNLDLSNELTSHTMNNVEIAKKIKTNIKEFIQVK